VEDAFFVQELPVLTSRARWNRSACSIVQTC